MRPESASAPVRLLLAAALFALPLSSRAAESAQIFKCTDASGNVTYQNEACPKASKSGRIELFDNRWTATKEEREAEWRRTAADRRIVAGMPAHWVREALGEPTQIRDTPTAGAAQLWLYTLPDRSVQIGMLNDQVLWFRENPTARTGQNGGERPAAEPAAPQVSRSTPPVERPANLPTTRLAPPPPEREPADTARLTPADTTRIAPTDSTRNAPIDSTRTAQTATARTVPADTARIEPASGERGVEAPALAQGTRMAAGPITPAGEAVGSDAAPSAPPAAAAATGSATAPAAVSGTTATAAATGGTPSTAAVKTGAPRAVARGQDCKQVLADLGPPSRQRDVPALDASSDPATEYFYESASDAGRLRIVCSNGKVEGVDRSVGR